MGVSPTHLPLAWSMTFLPVPYSSGRKPCEVVASPMAVPALICSGVTPGSLALSCLAVVRTSSQLFGCHVPGRPARRKSCLLKYSTRPSVPTGTPYCLPPTWVMPAMALGIWAQPSQPSHLGPHHLVQRLEVARLDELADPGPVDVHHVRPAAGLEVEHQPGLVVLVGGAGADELDRHLLALRGHLLLEVGDGEVRDPARLDVVIDAVSDLPEPTGRKPGNSPRLTTSPARQV